MDFIVSVLAKLTYKSLDISTYKIINLNGTK